MTDMKLDEAVSTVARFAKMFEAVQVLAAEIDKVKKIDALTQEAEQRRALRQKDADEAEAAVADAQKRLEAAKASAGQAKDDAQLIINQTRADAEKLIADAKAEAARVVSEALTRASEVSTIAASEKAVADAKIKSLEEEAAALNAKIADSANELANIEKQISKARTLFKGFMTSID